MIDFSKKKKEYKVGVDYEINKNFKRKNIWDVILGIRNP